MWFRCKDGTIHLSRCASGHQGKIRAPLLLFDPGLAFAIFSPAPLVSEAQARAEGELLVERLRGSVGTEERDRCLKRIEIVQRELLGNALASPQLNVNDFAPGADPNDELYDVYEMLRAGNFDLVQKIIESGKAAPAVASALRFEAGMHCNRLGSASPDSFEKAIHHYYAALDFFDRQRFPHRWAAVHSELALSFLHRPQGDPRENLREAVRCSDAALEVFQIDVYPEDFAITQSNRASALLDSKWDRPRSMELGIEAYREALRVYNRESYPHDWALVYSNMATAFIERGSSQDLRDAADALEKTLAVRSRADSPHDWALTQMNLGLALRRLPEDISGPGKRKAIEAFRAAYEVLQKGGTARERLAIMYNLGSTLGGSDDAKVLSEAADLLEQSRTTFLDAGNSAELEDCTKELARVYLNWARHARELRVEICARALRSLESEENSEEVGVFFHEIACLLNEAPAAGGIDLPVRAAKRALCILRTKSQAEFRAKALFNLGLTYLRQDMKSRALSCFEASIRIFQKLEPTPERTEAIGELYIYSTAATE
jgi:tetratricopeptide (TPR) repeat protein